MIQAKCDQYLAYSRIVQQDLSSQPSRCVRLETRERRAVCLRLSADCLDLELVPEQLRYALCGAWLGNLYGVPACVPRQRERVVLVCGPLTLCGVSQVSPDKCQTFVPTLQVTTQLSVVCDPVKDV